MQLAQYGEIYVRSMCHMLVIFKLVWCWHGYNFFAIILKSWPSGYGLSIYVTMLFDRALEVPENIN